MSIGVDGEWDIAFYTYRSRSGFFVTLGLERLLYSFRCFLPVTQITKFALGHD